MISNDPEVMTTGDESMNTGRPTQNQNLPDQPRMILLCLVVTAQKSRQREEPPTGSDPKVISAVIDADFID